MTKPWATEVAPLVACCRAYRQLGRPDAADRGRRHTLNPDYAYPAYGVRSPETLDAIRLCARLEGMLTDPVYEGKSMQALIDMIARGEFPPVSSVLYVHLGGVPALSDYSYPFRNG